MMIWDPFLFLVCGWRRKSDDNHEDNGDNIIDIEDEDEEDDGEMMMMMMMKIIVMISIDDHHLNEWDCGQYADGHTMMLCPCYVCKSLVSVRPRGNFAPSRCRTFHNNSLLLLHRVYIITCSLLHPNRNYI